MRTNKSNSNASKIYEVKINIKYLCAFFVVLITEIIIAVFVKDNFIRNNLGDVLVVVLIYCFIKTFIRNEMKLLWLYIFIFAVLIEIGQYFNNHLTFAKIYLNIIPIIINAAPIPNSQYFSAILFLLKENKYKLFNLLPLNILKT